MAEDRTSKEEEAEKGFVVKDKRFSAPKEEGQVGIKEEKRKEESGESGRQEREAPLPEITFPNFVISLSTSALIQLGEIEDPTVGKAEKNLPLAKQTIDIIGMLKEKTKGNLSGDEEKLIDYVLYDLRMRYVKATG
jgi:hypothetical protein